ncbi:MAG TPA: hypothetical protein IGS37_18735 [Synechococcales cyanobacterium M55_K2018_004]|nr:hypothetical protein [Synechococcales cyanobacterium M55_K2018_004]
MASSTPLQGIELIDCARANATQGIEVAAQLCGYGDNLSDFSAALQGACQHIGIDISELSDLIRADAARFSQRDGIEFAPDTDASL